MYKVLRRLEIGTKGLIIANYILYVANDGPGCTVSNRNKGVG